MQNDNDNKPAATLPAVHRFAAAPAGLFKVQMPVGAEILDVVPGSKGFNIYALVTPDAAKEWRYFLMTPTGQAIPNGWELNHVKTVIAGGPALHLFGVPKAIAKKIGFKSFAKTAVKP